MLAALTSLRDAEDADAIEALKSPGGALHFTEEGGDVNKDDQDKYTPKNKDHADFVFCRSASYHVIS